MPFYVPLGHRGLIFRFGSLLTGVLGGYIYWRATRRRARDSAPSLVPIPVRSDDDRRPE